MKRTSRDIENLMDRCIYNFDRCFISGMGTVDNFFYEMTWGGYAKMILWVTLIVCVVGILFDYISSIHIVTVVVCLWILEYTRERVSSGE